MLVQNTNIWEFLFTWNDEVSFRYLLRIHPVKDEEKKKLTVTFKTAHNTIICHKIKKKKKNQRKPKRNPRQCFFPILSFPHYFLCFSPSNFVLLSLVLRHLTWSSIFLDFMRLVQRSHVLKIILSWAPFAIRNRLIFHVNIAIGIVLHKCKHIFQMKWDSGKLSCSVTVSARDFSTQWRADQCTPCGI